MMSMLQYQMCTKTSFCLTTLLCHVVNLHVYDSILPGITIIQSTHHPFTAPVPRDEEILLNYNDPDKLIQVGESLIVFMLVQWW